MSSLDSFREEGRREKAKKYLQIYFGLLLINWKTKGLNVKVSVREKKSEAFKIKMGSNHSHVLI